MHNNKRLYYKYSDYLKDKYQDKVYKLPVNLPVTCPNRLQGEKGCHFCAEVGTGFEMLSDKIDVENQLLTNKAYIKKKYKANKFIAYFQNYTNTFLPLDDFEKYINEAIIDDVVEIAISTRPDCIRKDYLEVLSKAKEKGVEITIELGLQTVNYHTLDAINRGHSLAEFINGVMLIKSYGFEICTHLILNLPGDQQLDSIENAKVLSALGINQIKLHSLYIAKNTTMAQLYRDQKIQICSKEDYIERVIAFLEHLSPDVAVQRLLGRAPKEETLFCNWNTSWWLIKEAIENNMTQRRTYQGKKYNYLNGSGLMKGCY
ncbi:hypothetical protein EDC19_0517 [Natranaerovirga hydrolytica]|uniref:Radical SAM core domain-containing protein n=1 Tax=Natranaerovirga hydrolytica TaxID=680378 RepID=A0A4R1MZQ0_9FIRM|nr:TIGR01212 family radical SAM protein [Natranaerovirga hydrolytica]TCK98100.1 hypothetical protein EDC19_0517 [Natranaerovirga hydrolytica]